MEFEEFRRLPPQKKLGRAGLLLTGEWENENGLKTEKFGGRRE